MGTIKTKPDEHEVEWFLQSLDAKRLDIADTLIDIMTDITGKPAVMWGKDMIGFNKYHYRTKSGQEADWPVIAFSPRKAKISLYITFSAEQYLPLINEIGGKTSIGKGCIYISKFEQVNITKLTKLIEKAYTDSMKVLPSN